MDLLTARENDENAKKLSMLLKQKVAIFFNFLKIALVVVIKLINAPSCLASRGRSGELRFNGGARPLHGCRVQD